MVFRLGGQLAMDVEAILRSKGRDVATLPPEKTLRDLVEQLAERRLGAMVVTDPGADVIRGIISERDVVRAFARHGSDALNLKVGDVMTVDVITCRPADPITDLMGMMTQRQIRHMPVVVDGRLVGIVSIGDVVKFRLGELDQEVGMWRELFQPR
jgi:CBS domain-containing protein